MDLLYVHPCSGTHDIFNASITDNDILISTDYFAHSSALGALYTFLFMDENGVINLKKSIYLALNKSASLRHYLQYTLNRGTCIVLVYDIESNGRLPISDADRRVGYPAVYRNLTTSEDTSGKCSLAV